MVIAADDTPQATVAEALATIENCPVVFNVLNRVNYAGQNMTWGTALAPRDTYLEFTSANDPRQLQFGVKFEF